MISCAIRDPIVRLARQETRGGVKSTKSETRNPKQTAMTRKKCSKQRFGVSRLSCASDLFRVSGFGFRIWGGTARKRTPGDGKPTPGVQSRFCLRAEKLTSA